MPRLLRSTRALSIAAAFVFATLIAIALATTAQIVSIQQWCEHDAGRDLHLTTPEADLRIGAMPVIVCRSGSTTTEIPVAPGLVSIATALIGAAVGLLVVIRITEPLRARAVHQFRGGNAGSPDGGRGTG